MAEIKVTTSDLITVTQAAKTLNKARLTIYRWIKSGNIIGIQLAGVMFIPKSEIDRIKNNGAKED